ncbi:MAG: ATP-binding cassette domain-containing protein [Ferroplasma sp.]
MIELNGISKYYKIRDGIAKWHDFYALENINMVLRDSMVTGVCGISGSGKTTLATIISGYQEYDSGNISYNKNGKIYSEIKQNNYIRNVFQDPYTSLNSGMDVAWHIENTALLNGIPLENAIEKLRIVGMEYSDFSERYIDTLSGGERQKLAFAISLIPEPDVLILDEPFSMLDTLSLFYELQLLKKLKNKIIVYFDNSIDRVLFVSDYIYILDEGKIIESNYVDNFAGQQNSNVAQKLIKYSPSIFKRI